MYHMWRPPVRPDPTLEPTAADHHRHIKAFFRRWKASVKYIVPLSIMARISGRFLAMVAVDPPVVHRWQFPSGEVLHSETLFWVALLDETGSPIDPL